MKQYTILMALLILAGQVFAYVGPAGALIEQIKPAFVGGDAQARTDLRQMTRDIMIPPVIDEAARATHESDLLNGIMSAKSATVQQFLLQELLLVGKSESINPLGTLLDNDSLYEDATQVLLAIYNSTGDAKAQEAVRTAMGSAAGNKLMAFMQAAGSMRDSDPATLTILKNNAGSSDWNLKAVALRGLANIGDPGSRDVLKNAIGSATNMYQKSMIISWNLLYAERLAQGGMKTEATAICDEITALAGSADLGGSRSNCHAITAADFLKKEIPNITVTIGKPEGKNSGKAPQLDIMADKGLRINISAEGAYAISIRDAKGRSLWTKEGTSPGHFRLPGNLLGAGIYTVSVTTEQGKTVKSISVR